MRSKFDKFEGEFHVEGCSGELGNCMGGRDGALYGGMGTRSGARTHHGPPPCGQTDMTENFTFAPL